MVIEVAASLFHPPVQVSTPYDTLRYNQLTYYCHNDLLPTPEPCRPIYVIDLRNFVDGRRSQSDYSK